MKRFFILFIIFFCSLSFAQTNAPTSKNRTFELSATMFSFGKLGPRAVVYFGNCHGLYLEYSNSFDSGSVLNFYKFLSPVGGYNEVKNISNHKQVGYRYFPFDSVYFQAGVAETFMSYRYLKCRDQLCATSLGGAEWSGTTQSAVLTIGYQIPNGKYLVVGGELVGSVITSRALSSQSNWGSSASDQDVVDAQNKSKQDLFESDSNYGINLYIGVSY